VFTAVILNVLLLATH